jgi:hypothetical protein
MDYAGTMSDFEPFANLNSILDYLTGCKGSPVQPVGKSLSFQVFHHQIVDSILVAHIVESTDVRMVQGRDRACFAVESLLGLRVFRKVRGKNLDGDDALEPCIQRAINLAHAASSER